MAIVKMINQKDGMVMPTRKRNQKMSLKRVKQKKKIYILGDKMVNHIKGQDLSANLDNGHNICVAIFPRAEVRSMKDYTKPYTREENLDQIILPTGQNDLISNNSPERVGKPIADLFHNNRKVAVSGIIPRNDEWTNNAELVNNHLREMRKSVNIDFIDNGKNFNLKKNNK